MFSRRGCGTIIMTAAGAVAHQTSKEPIACQMYSSLEASVEAAAEASLSALALVGPHNGTDMELNEGLFC